LSNSFSGEEAMAPDFSDPPVKFGRGFREFTFEPSSETAHSIPVDEDTSLACDMALGTITTCIDLLMRARKEERIEFAAGVTAEVLETTGILLMRASNASNRRREQIFRHWGEAGVPMVEDLVAAVAARPDRLLRPVDIRTMFMGKPPGY
jgi:hypothetical protein